MGNYSKNKIAIVLGMHRSGTSTLAKALIDLGFDAGKNLMPANQDNPKGYWEDIDIYNLNNEILSYLSIHWDDVENIDTRKIELFSNKIWEHFGEQALKIIKNRLGISSNIILKDPRFNILFPFWNQVFDCLDVQRFYFFSLRNPLDVAKSLNKRNELSLKNALVLWYYYCFSVFNDLNNDVCIVSYENVLKQPEEELSKIADFCKLNVCNSNDTIKEFANSFVEKNLNHHQSSQKELLDNTNFLTEITDFYQLLLDASQNQVCNVSHELLSKFKIQNLSEYYVKNETATLTSTLFYEDSKSNNLRKQIQLKHVTGESTLCFDFKENNQSDLITVFLCDKPCIIEFERIIIHTIENEHIISVFDGNYLHKENKLCFFNTNSPYIKFTLPQIENIIKINIDVNIDVRRDSLLRFLIPVYNIKSDQANQSINKYKLEINRYKILIAEREDNNTFLLNELEGLKQSISWKITKPFRASRKKLMNLVTLFFPKYSNTFDSGFEILKRKGFRCFIKQFFKHFIKKSSLIEDDTVLEESKSINSLLINIDTITPFAIKKEELPLVSIIIPVHNQWKFTYNCLKSIKEHTNDISYEIIIADDASSDETINIADVIKNIKILRNEKALGFIKNCNQAAKVARGKYLHFLNNDTEVHPKWLSSLVKLAEEDSQIGILGSKLIYPDGKLQEAGGIIWNDASGWNYGRLNDPEKPEYNYLKDVDYVSGASLLIKKETWDNLGGFDEHFIPAYYEDTNLAFKARTSGLRVVYQPLSVVTHFEGISNGKDITGGIKKYQTVNQFKFKQRWNKILEEEHFPNGVNVFTARERSSKKMQVLVIDHQVPHYNQDAGSRSTYSYLKLLVKMGYNVKFIGDNYLRNEPYTTILQQIGIEVLYGDDYQKNIHLWIRKNGNYFDYIFVHRMEVAQKYLAILKKYTRAKLIYVGHDLQFMSSKRKFEVTKNENHKKDIIKFKQAETKIFKTVDIISPFSVYEAPFIKEIVPEKIVQPIPVYFYDNLAEIINKFNNRKDILFVGGFGHPPNIDAILWFVNNIFPIIKSKIPDIKLYIVGSKPTKEVLDLSSEAIVVTGFVTDEELTWYYQNCRVALLPLRFGAGVKGKLIEALYYQLPVVITSVAAEGIPEIERYSLIADDVKEFAEKVHLLYTNEDVWNKYATNGKLLIEKYFSEKAALKIIEEIFEKAM